CYSPLIDHQQLIFRCSIPEAPHQTLQIPVIKIGGVNLIRIVFEKIAELLIHSASMPSMHHNQTKIEVILPGRAELVDEAQNLLVETNSHPISNQAEAG